MFDLLTGRLFPAKEEAAAPKTLKTPGSVLLGFTFAVLAGLLFGYDIGSTSSVVQSIGSLIPLSAFQISFLTCSSLIGATVSSIAMIWYADVLGRRGCLLWASACFALGTAISITAPASVVYAWVAVGKLVYGVGIALAMNGAPAYIAEIAPAHIRGTLIALKEGFIVGGMVLGCACAIVSRSLALGPLAMPTSPSPHRLDPSASVDMACPLLAP